MIDSIIVSVFQKTDIAEINSLKLYDYEHSLNNYFIEDKNSSINQQYFEWFSNPKFEKTNNSFLKDFNKWFIDYFF
ncbi:MAG: hypothetical protein ACFE9C_11610 [Candidatus Hodarchaeota archaeon]